MRPTDLAQQHGISTQAVRNYEAAGVIPSAHRTDAGYRRYTEVHAVALRAYLSTVSAYGYAAAGHIMRALHHGRLDDALEAVDRGHDLLLRDRSTLNKVAAALEHLQAEADGVSGSPQQRQTSFSVGELGRRLGTTPATLRNWEQAGILRPGRNPSTGHRTFDADDVRDADMAHLLRRGGYLLHDIAAIADQVRAGGGTSALSDALQNWRNRLTTRGLAMLTAAGHLAEYIELINRDPLACAVQIRGHPD